MSFSEENLVIENDYWIVDLHRRGASVTRLFPRAVGRSILRDSRRELSSGRHSAAYPVPTLFGPKLGSGVFVDGKSYNFPSTFQMPSHGVEVDQLYRVEAHEEQATLFSLELHEQFPGYPFRSRILVSYELQEKLFRINIAVQNMEKYFSVPAMSVWHPYFARYLNSQGGIGNHLQFETDVTEILRYEGSEPIPQRPAEMLLPHETFLRARPLLDPYDNSMKWRSRAARLYWAGYLDLTLRANSDWLHLYNGDDRCCCIEPALAPANGLTLAQKYALPAYASVVAPGAERCLQVELEIAKFA